jgi:hypothetical protein
MNTCMIESNKVCISETEIVNIAIEFLSDGCSMSECRGHLLCEYDVEADDLGRLLEQAQSEVRTCGVEFGSRVRF